MKINPMIVNTLLVVSLLLIGLPGRVFAQAPGPVANAGPDVVGEAGRPLILDGSLSTGTGLSFQWRQTAGPAVTLAGADTSLASFIFPFLVGLNIPTMVFELTVTDVNGLTAVDTMMVIEAVLPPPAALNTIPVPEPANLAAYVSNRAAAVQLGKALFWDMQVGSDGIQACASCHYAAGADNRVVNQVNPGPNGVFEAGSPNSTLQPSTFPFHVVANPIDRMSQILRSLDDVAGTQGVLRADMLSLRLGEAVEEASLVADPVFNVGGVNTRQVTGRSAPSVINAVYFLRNFWDGRASNVFNGVNTRGVHDPDAHIWEVQPTGAVAPALARLENSSLASQAVGPAGSDVEMSWKGRRFPQIGKKLLSLTPLGNQQVSASDSVLGMLANPVGNGLTATYAQLIQVAFPARFWNATQIIVYDAAGTPTVANAPGRPLAANEFTLMEANFSLFFGLAIQLYESTLVSGETPFDRFQMGDRGAMTAEQQHGLDLFVNVVQCAVCHMGPEFSSATVSALVGVEPGGILPDPGVVVERMAMASGDVGIYDLGFYNIGVRPTAEDLGIGNNDALGNPLSFSRMAQLGIPIGPPMAFNPVVNPAEYAAVNGAFKTPGLRNVELTAPYMHNGSMATLEQVVQFYARGSNFGLQNAKDLAPAIIPLTILTPADLDALVAFLKALTDERVRYQRAPFDHPQLFIPTGDQLVEVSAVGAAGGAPIEPFVTGTPGLAVSKQAPAPVVQGGLPVTLTVTVTNTGTVNLRQMAFVDDLPGCSYGAPLQDQWSAGVLDVGETWVVTCTTALAATTTSRVDVSARDKLNQAVTGTASVAIGVVNPALQVSVAANATTVTVGDTIHYTVLITNTGDVALSAVRAIDSRLGAFGLDTTTLSPGATASGQLSYVAQPADIPGLLTTHIFVSAQPPAGANVFGLGAVSVDVLGPALAVVVVADKTTANVGDPIGYRVVVTNTGDVPLSAIAANDPRLGQLVFANQTLAPGASTIASAGTVVQETDLGQPLAVTVTATGAGPGGQVVNAQASATTAVTGQPALLVTRTSNRLDATVGDAVGVDFIVKNVGPITLGGLVARDSYLGLLSLDGAQLAPGASAHATGVRTVVEGDLPGPLVGSVVVTGTPLVAGLPAVRATGDDMVVLHAGASIALAIVPDRSSARVGDVVTFAVTVANTGKVTVRTVAVNDDRLGPVTLDRTTLAPGESAHGVAQLTVRAADLPGPYRSQVTASGTLPARSGVVTTTMAASVALESRAALGMSVQTTPGPIGLGNGVTYAVVVSNTGTVALANVGVVDSRLGAFTINATTLAPGQSAVGTYTYTVRERDLPGPLISTITARGLPAFTGSTPVTATVDTLVAVMSAPAMVLTLSAPVSAAIGQPVDYVYRVKNTGNVTLRALAVVDSRFGVVQLPSATLAPGASVMAERRYTIQQTDLPSPLHSQATASAMPTAGAAISAHATAAVALASHPKLAVTQERNLASAGIGRTVQFQIFVQNEGDVTLANVAAISDRFGALALDRTELAPGQSAAALVSHVVVQADLPGPLVNRVAVTGVPKYGAQTGATATGTSSVTLSESPAIDIVRQSSASRANVGDTVTIIFTVKNLGNVTLTNIQAADSLLGELALPTTLLPAQSATLTRPYVVKETDLPSPLAAMVTVRGVTLQGNEVTASARSVVQVIGAPAVDVSVTVVTGRTATGGDGNRANIGDSLTLHVVVKNIGNVTLRGVSAVEDHAGALALGDATLAPGATSAGSLQYVVQASDLPGPLTFHVMVSGIGVDGGNASRDASTTIILPSARVVSAVWLDLDANGTRSSDEPGMGGVEVHLCQAPPGVGCVATTTAADGSFAFEDRFPGQYRLAVTIPVGYRPTQQASSPDGINDSDVDGLGLSGEFSLAAGGIEDRVGAGFVVVVTPTALEPGAERGANHVYLPAVKR